MKKFSIAALILFCVPVFIMLNSPAAIAADKAKCSFSPNAPDQHVVVKGDTLWGISGKFLEHPWCWPQVWGMNREEIRNPHWIYPGQVVYFDRAAGRLRLGTPAGTGETPTVRLSPKIRSAEIGKEPIPAIDARIIEPFLSQALVVDKAELDMAPRIVATQENHVTLGNGDKAYVRGDLQGNTKFQVFRSPVPLKDPVTGIILGYEAKHLGTLMLVRTATATAVDEAHTFVVTNAREEMGIGDRLMPSQAAPILSYMPHSPENQIDARVVSIYGGVSHAGQNQVVSINRGKRMGIDPGTVLVLARAGKIVPDLTDRKHPVSLPAEEYGNLFIFRVFDNVSYGLIMQVKDTVVVGDAAKSPE